MQPPRPSHQPLWSVMIPTFNSAKYLRETLESVLRQQDELGDGQLCVVDNGSTDATEAIVRDTGKGRVDWVRNDRNYGVMGNFNRCVELARGSLLHILNSDDLVLPGFYHRYSATFSAHPEVCIVTSTSALIDDHGGRLGQTSALPELAQPSNDVSSFMYLNPVRTPSVVVRREAYSQFGSFDTNLLQTGDWDMWTRLIRNCRGLHLDEILTQYREHAGNESSKVYRSGENILDTERLFRKFLDAGYPIARQRYTADLCLAAYGQYLQLRLRRDPAAATLKNIFHRLKQNHRALAGPAAGSRLELRRIFHGLKQSVRFRVKG